MFKPLWFRRVFCASLLILTSGMLACGGEEENAQGPGARGGHRAGGQAGGMMGRMGGSAAIPVEAKPVERGDIDVSLLTYTTIEAERHVDVIARVQGLVKTLYVEEGDRVKRGQALAKLDENELKLQAREREVNLQSLQAVLDRAEDLRNKELISNEEFEQIRYQYETARTQYESAKLNLAYATIRSPFSGIVTDRLIEVGNLVNVNQAVFRAADFNPLLARIFVPERQIRDVKLGQSVRIVIEGSEDTFTGQVRMISPIVDPESGTVKVTVEIRDKTGILRPGMFATVNIITEVHENVLRVEKKALVSEAEGTFAFLFKGGSAKKTRLKLGEDEGNWTEVMDGITEGDSIITVGHDGLRNGAPVRIAGAPVALPEMAAGPASGGQDMQRPAQGRQGPPGGGQGMMDLDRMKERMLKNPKIKEAYDKRVKEDPDFERNEEKQRLFFRKMFQQMRDSGGGQRRQ